MTDLLVAVRDHLAAIDRYHPDVTIEAGRILVRADWHWRNIVATRLRASFDVHPVGDRSWIVLRERRPRPEPDGEPCGPRCKGVLVHAGQGVDDNLRAWTLRECSRCGRVLREEQAEHPGQGALL